MQEGEEILKEPQRKGISHSQRVQIKEKNFTFSPGVSGVREQNVCNILSCGLYFPHSQRISILMALIRSDIPIKYIMSPEWFSVTPKDHQKQKLKRVFCSVKRSIRATQMSSFYAADLILKESWCIIRVCKSPFSGVEEVWAICNVCLSVGQHIKSNCVMTSSKGLNKLCRYKRVSL